jgi:hypothetical protein
MPKSSPAKRPSQGDRHKPPSADPKETRGKYWERERPPFDAAHTAFEASVQAQRQLVGAVAGKLGIDVKELTRGQLEAFDAIVKVASSLPTDIPDSGEPQP